MAATISPVKCIFFSEFHPVTGPRIVCQAPEEFPIREAFDAVRDLIITKPQLYDRLITVDAGSYRIVGCPKSIEDNKYARNALIFNVVFVFEAQADTSPYEAMVQKLGEAFKTYELEVSFLSLDESRKKLPMILSKIRSSLNELGMCVIPIDESNMLHLKITPSLAHPPAVHNHNVPIFTCSHSQLTSCTWDLTVQEIICHINGFNHIKRIAELSEVSMSNVKECIQHLVIYGFATIIDIFQYCNVYVATPKLPQLLKDADLQAQCVEYVSLSDSEFSCVSDVFRLLCSLEPGLTVKDLCFRNDPNSFNIDEKRLIQFGLMHGLIRHVRKYPVLVGTELSQNLAYLRPYLNGCCCFDEICCELGISNQALDDELEMCQDVVICWK